MEEEALKIYCWLILNREKNEKEKKLRSRKREGESKKLDFFGGFLIKSFKQFIFL